MNKPSVISPRARSVDKKTAVKLINNYAESYKKKETENAELQRQIDDLQNGLKLNKVIINTLTSSLSDDEKIKELIMNLNIEISNLYSQNQELRTRLEEAKSNIICSEKIAQDNINKEKAEIAKFKDLVFIQENKITKLESENSLLRKKRQEKYKDDEFQYNIKEVFITDPCQAVININDELILYKNIYSSLSNHYRALQISINQYECLIQELKFENAKLEREIREKDKQIILSTANTKIMNTQSHLTKLQTEMNIREEDINKRLSTHNNESDKPKLVKLSSVKTNKNFDEFNSDSSFDMNNQKAKNISETYNPSYPLTPITPIDYMMVTNKKLDKLDISEWREVVRIVGFTEDEYNNLFVRSNKNSKFSEAVDIYNTIIVDRNQQINILNLENSKLNNENKVLYDENILLNKKILLFEQKISQLSLKIEELKSKSNRKRHLDLNSTLCDDHTIDTNKNELIMNSIANTPSSMITINRVNIKALNQITTTRQYHKNGNSDKLLDYYKKVIIPEDSSNSEFDDEEHFTNRRMNLTLTGEHPRKRLYSIHSAQDRKKKKLKIDISNENANTFLNKTSNISKRSIKTQSNSTSVNCDTNRINRGCSSLKSRVMERLDIPEKKSNLQVSSDHIGEFIKIEDQKDAFFELSHNIKAIKEIHNINKNETIEKDSNHFNTQQQNPAIKAMNKLLYLSNKDSEPKVKSLIKRNEPRSTMSRHEKVKNLNYLVDQHMEAFPSSKLNHKGAKQVTFESMKSRQFKSENESFVNDNNMKQDNNDHAQISSIRFS